ncbi:VOC family protein [Pelagibacterium flavum]|uniref:VOC family protein n=1 Tax=Pelagibacterium flavum TaxID=2984530 RepID=A0ABY6IL13_9HYPH|nr:VOC family protein [Pelagibacterium sp. YIM 151497]MAN76746.1 lactoylglutathione lyase [Hyphomicrobiales bacterium]UYQ71283.1 VOC family protein [Pelagibacterium sp. YIM 151497]|tara:strand:- start:6483 stop:6914 length:432 start_codon:yes stop_codon:yes gene_type:complete
MLTVSRITHIAIKVTDIEATLAFYVGRLGFQEMFRLDREGRLWIVYLSVSDTQYLEIFPGGEGVGVPGPERTGYNHLCLEVPDIGVAARELEAAGVELSKPVVEGADGNRQAWIEDPDGHRIELMEMSPNSMQAEAIARLKGE